MMSILLQNWNMIRVLRLIIGSGIIYQGFSIGDKSIGILGLLFTLLSLFNIRCCGDACVITPKNKNTQENAQEIIYEDVK